MSGFTSILFPHGYTSNGVDHAASCLSDLHVDEIIAAVIGEHPDDHLERVFYAPLQDVFTVEYRHQVFRDLENDQTRKAIADFVDCMQTMRRQCHQANEMRHPLQRQGWFIYAVQTFCDTVESLRDRLADAEPVSQGLNDFVQYLSEYADSDAFRGLVSDNRSVQSELSMTRYTVHIQGQRVRVEKYGHQTDYGEGAVAAFARFATEASRDYRVPLKDYPDMNQVEERILECVAALYPDAFAMLDQFCRRNERFAEPTIVHFDQEIRFYLHYVDFVDRISNANLHFSYPEVTVEPGVLTADDAFDLALAIKSVAEKQPLVCNDFNLSELETIIVVTGPNQGGKTTLARSIGQCAYLASLGCPIPAKHARFTLPDHIYTHFERQETLLTLRGKLEDELTRMHDILKHATATSIIIMNESFSSTTIRDASLIGTDILQRIIKLRCLAVYVTFLDELASLDQACVSMVGEVTPGDSARRTFKFTRRAADGLAYATGLLNKYELNHDALRRRISR